MSLGNEDADDLDDDVSEVEWFRVAYTQSPVLIYIQLNSKANTVQCSNIETVSVDARDVINR